MKKRSHIMLVLMGQWLRFGHLVVALVLGLQGIAQPVQWQLCQGGDQTEHARSIANAQDGSYMVAGYTRSNSYANQARNTPGGMGRSDSDFFLTKVSSRGRTLWTRFYGGTYAEEAYHVALTNEGGYVLCGYTNSTGLTNGEKDFYLVRTDKLGEPLWQQHYGGADNEIASVVIPLPDGGFIVAGEANSSGTGDVTQNRGSKDAWVIRLDRKGNLLWEKNFGGSLNDRFASGVLADANTVILVGSTESTDGDCASNHGGMDVFVARIDIGKSTVWAKCMGGSLGDEGYSVLRTPDGQFVLSGTSFSSDGDVDTSRGQGDFWVVKFDVDGNIAWSNTYGGTRNDGANSIAATFDGHFIVAGTTGSEDGHVTNYHGLFDGWIIKLSNSGALVWQRAMGGSQKEEFLGVVESAGGDYVAVGYTGSGDGDLSGVLRKGQSDTYIVAVKDPETNIRAISLTPTVIMGYVRDSVTRKFVAAEVTLVDNKMNRTLFTSKSDTAFGIYQLLMPDTLQMSVGVFAPGYFFESFNISISNLQRYGEIRRDIVLRPIVVGDRVNLYNIQFNTGSDQLLPESRTELNRLSEFLKKNPSVRIMIHGHTDSTGNAQTKHVLSERRARQVKIYLMALEITPGRMEYRGWGMSKPLGPENTEYERQLNRRVEIEILAR